MRRKVDKSIFVLFLGVTTLFLFSCSKDEGESTAAKEPEPVPPQEEELPEEAVTETEDLTAVDAPTYDEAFVVFSSGVVDFKPADSEDWLPVEIGQTLTQDDSLRVSDASYCELQFGDSAVVKVKEATTLSLAQVSTREGSRNVKMKMQAGSILNRVEKLAQGEQFKVQTPSAVCGVRGTQFGVETTKDKKTRVAVKEGTVAVQPGTVDPDELKEKVKGRSEELDRAIEQLEQSASVVSSNQEIDVDEETAQESDETAVKVANVVEEIVTKEEEAPSREQIAEVSRLAEETRVNVAERQVAPKEITEESNEELLEINDMKLLEITSVEKAAEEVSETEAKPMVPDFHKVAVEVEPKNALISLNGRGRGRGSFSGVFNSNEELSFEIRREGFEPHSFSLTVNEESSKLYRIKLAKVEKEEPVTEKFEIQTVPEDADILKGGDKVATGSYSESFELGEKVSFSVQKEGYKEQQVSIDVSLGSGKTYKVDLDRKTEEVRISAEPSDSDIFLDGRNVGTGSFEDEFPVGETLDVQIRKEGWKERSFELNVEEGAPLVREVSLERMLQGVQITASPRDAEILLDGERVGRGSFSDQYEPGERLSFTIRSDGYRSKNLDLTVTDEVQSHNVSLERRLQEVIVRAEPRDAEILINGRSQGRGSVSQQLPEGRRLNITARKPGYESKSVSYTTGSEGSKSFSLELEPMPMQFTADVSDSGLIGNAVSYGNMVVTANTNGRLYAVSREGEKVWEVETNNGRNENSYPVVMGNNIFFTGANEMVKVRADNGSILSRTPLSGDSAHLFGRRVVAHDGSLLMPTNSSIRILDPATGNIEKEIEVPGGSRMTPAIWNGKIVTVNQQGTLLIIDPDSSSVESEVSTAGMQPVALAPSIRDNRAIFSGRKGTVVCVDLDTSSVVWERDLPGDSVSVFSDPECSPQGVYIFAGGAIYGLSMTDGSNFFSPISGATSPPLYRDGKLYYGTASGGLTVADATTGRRSGGVDSEKRITTRPVVNGASIVAGTDDGTILVMSP